MTGGTMPRVRLLVTSLLVLTTATAAAQPSSPPPGEPAPPPGEPAPPPGEPAPPPPHDPYGPPAAHPPPHPYPPHPYPPHHDPYGYPPPPPPPYVEPTGELEVIADFAVLGVLASLTLLDLRDYGDPGSGTLLVLAGALGGGATGWILGDRLGVSRVEGRLTTMGLAVGLINGALLLVPLDRNDHIGSEQVLSTLLIGGTAGAVGGLVVGRRLDLTRGQTYFAGTLSLLGLGTSALASALLYRDGDGLGRPEMTSLVVGLDGGLAAGLLLAPKVDWSPGRARFVGAATLVGTFLGGMVGGLLATGKDAEGNTTTHEEVAVLSMLVGMWGGFAGGIALSSDWAPDARYRAAPGPAITALPMLGDGRVGLVATGTF
jgi:hypothetical protein